MINWEVDLKNTITSAGMILAIHKCQGHLYKYGKGAWDSKAVMREVYYEFRDVFVYLVANKWIVDFQIVCDETNNPPSILDKGILVSVQCKETASCNISGIYDTEGRRRNLLLEFVDGKLKVSLY